MCKPNLCTKIRSGGKKKVRSAPLGLLGNQIPDSFIEAVIRAVRRLQERETYGRPVDEATNEEAKTA